jgi:hypothetical protein
VDSQPPTVEKAVGDPKHACESVEECHWYVTVNTPFTLTATDYSHAANKPIQIFYKYCWSGAEKSSEECTDWMLYNGTFTYAQDSWHVLYYYAVDYIGNVGQMYTEYDIVDTQNPELVKEVGDPKVSCARLGRTDCDYFVTTQTPISLICTDQQPHPVNHVATYYRYKVNDGDFTDWFEYDGSFTFPEESKHYLEYYCEDALGNKIGIYNETDFVEDTPPVTTKTVGEPKHECEDDEECDLYITQNTEISFNCTDVDPHPVGMDAIYFRYKINDGEFGNWTVYEQPFKFTEDSRHTIEYYCVDLLGNTEEVQDEVDVVDTQMPELTKLVGEPKVSCSTEPIVGKDCTETSTTYTMNSDFDLGTLTNVEYATVADQLQIKLGSVTTYPLMYIANAGEDSLSKWDTTNNKELARYHTWFGPLGNHGEWTGPAPSRTAVDSDGNVYVANRHFDGLPADVIKVYADNWIDRNGNGVMDTSFDANNDGTISESETIPMTDGNSNNIIDPSEITDERVAWVSKVGPDGCTGRSLAIDLNGDIWLGCYSYQTYYKLDGDTGAVILGPINVAPNNPYGSLVDKYGILWGASLGTDLLRLDTNTLNVNNYDHSAYGYDYGIAIGYDGSGNTHVYMAEDGYSRTYIEYNSGTGTFSNPAAVYFSALGIATDKDGNIVTSYYGGGNPYKFAPNGSVIWNVPYQIYGEGRGIVVDSNNDVWVILRDASKMAKYRGSDGAALGVFNTGRGPYTYSDAAGLGFAGSQEVGSWIVIHDAGSAGAAQGPVTWNANVPTDTTLKVEVRSSEDQSAWSVWEEVTNGGAFSTTPNGRYLEVKVSFKGKTGTSPILYDLTIAGGCIIPQDNTCWFVNSSTPITINCQDGQPHPVDHVTIGYRTHYKYNETSEWGDWTNWTIINGTQVTFKLPEDSMHEVEYWCEDILGNKDEQKELDIVDNQGPTVVKTVGDPKHKCETSEGCDWYITQNTPISFVATDPLPHPVDRVKIYFRYNVDGGDWTDWFLYGNEIYFAEDSNHSIEYYAEDALGNKGPVYTEVDIVESQPPETTKAVGDPKHECVGHEGEEEGCNFYITQSTPITFTAIDPTPHPVNHVSTYYMYCLGQEIEEQFEWCSEWFNYTVSFNFPEDSRHTLFYYSEDALGNKEETQTEVDIVDTQQPVLEKQMGKPSISCSSLNQSDCHYYITNETAITLNCIDNLPHPVNHVMISYRWSLDDGEWTDWTNVEDSTALIQFQEDSKHQIEYKCIDALGNMAGVYNETDKVDMTPPNTTKIIMGNKTACDEGEGCDYYVCKDTSIGFSALDGGPICHVDGVITKYRYNVNNGPWTDWIAYDGSANFSFLEQGNYTIEYYSNDQLYNTETVQSEVDIFDTEKPNGWVLNPISGWHHDGEIFQVYAPAYDEGSPVSGFKTCSFLAIDIHFEQLTGSEYADVVWMMRNPNHFEELLAFLGPSRYTLVSLGSVPYVNGTCSGNVQIPNPSGLTDKAYLVMEITDRSCNMYYDLARDIDGDTIVMDMDNTPPNVQVTGTEGLGTPISTGDYFNVYLEALDFGTGLDQCSGEIIQTDCEQPTEGGDGSGSSDPIITPMGVIATLKPGESVQETKVVTTNSTPITAVDVLFQMDLTGSMESELNTVKTSSLEIMANVSDLVADSEFGAASFMDYPHSYDDSEINCGYGDTYGVATTDYAYSLDQDITSDNNLVSAAINGMSLGNGYDGPEDYSRALYESQFSAFRPSAKKILVIFGDNIPHDCTFNGYTTGKDPGRDEIINTADDLVFTNVVSQLAANKITVIAVDSGEDPAPWEYMANQTGGQYFQLGSASEIPNAIVNLIGEETSQIDEVTIQVQPGFEDWVTWMPFNYVDVVGNQTLTFNLTFTVPLNATPGEYVFWVRVVGDGSTLREQTIQITVPGECESIAEQHFDFSGGILSDSTCKVFGTVPTGLRDGSHKLTLYAMDRKFNKGNASTIMMVDNTPPEKTIISPLGNETFGQIIPIEIHALDLTGVKPSTVQYRIFEDIASLFGVPLGPEKYDSGWRLLPMLSGNAQDGAYGVDFNSTFEGLQDGKTYFMRVRLCDALFTGTLPNGAELPEHCSDPEITFKIDLAGPSTDLNVILSDKRLSWLAASDSSGIAYYNVYLNGVFMGSTTSTSYVTGGIEGVWEVAAVDTLGNIGPKSTAKPPAPATPIQTIVSSNGGSGSSSNGGGLPPKSPDKKVPACTTGVNCPEDQATSENGLNGIPIDVEPEQAISLPATESTTETQVSTIPVGSVGLATGFVSGSMAPWQIGLASLIGLGLLFFLTGRKNKKGK